MLKHRFKKINEIDQEIHDVEEKLKDSEEKTRRLKKFLSLKQTIKKFSQKENKTSEETSILDEMLVMHEEEKNGLAGYENTNQTLLNVNTANNSSIEPISPVISDNTPEQIVGENSLLQKIQEFKLKPVKKNEVQMKPIQMPKIEHDAPGFVMTQDALKNIKLNSIKPKNSVTSSPEDKPTELKLKLAERRALLEKKTVAASEESSSESDGDSKQIIPVLDEALSPVISNEGSGSDSEEDVDEFDLLENIFNVSGFQGDGVPEISRFKNALSIIHEDKTRPNSTMDELDELLESLKEQVSSLDNAIKKPQVPLSMHFNSAREDKPVILEAVLQPMP